MCLARCCRARQCKHVWAHTGSKAPGLQLEHWDQDLALAAAHELLLQSKPRSVRPLYGLVWGRDLQKGRHGNVVSWWRRHGHQVSHGITASRQAGWGLCSWDKAGFWGMTFCAQIWGSRSACGLLPCLCISSSCGHGGGYWLGRPNALIEAHFRGRKETGQRVICGLIKGASPSGLITLWLNFLFMGRMRWMREGHGFRGSGHYLYPLHIKGGHSGLSMSSSLATSPGSDNKQPWLHCRSVMGIICSFEVIFSWF